MRVYVEEWLCVCVELWLLRWTCCCSDVKAELGLPCIKTGTPFEGQGRALSP